MDSSTEQTAAGSAADVPSAEAAASTDARPNDILLRLFGELQDLIGPQRWVLARVRPNDFVARTYMDLTGRGSSIASAIRDLIATVKRFQEDPEAHVDAQRRQREGPA
jgi:hypothetical protein